MPRTWQPNPELNRMRVNISSPTRRVKLQRSFCSLTLVSAALLAPGFASALAQQATTQSVPAKPSAKSSSTSTKAHRKPAKAHAQPIVVPPTPPVVPEPPKPDWPANNRPSSANVAWNSQGLRIEATNSSLQQILKEVGTLTGTKIQGLGPDQRIFGTYGPGSARLVIGQLLEGSGYNVLMIGDQGQGTPRQIILSSQAGGQAPQPAAANLNSQDDDSADAQDQDQPQPEPPPPPARNGFAPGAPPRTPQQIMQEMQQRQQQIQRANPQD